MAKNNEALKKHHFWILFGASWVFVLLAVIFLMTGVSSAISTKQKEIDDSIGAVTKASPPGEGVIADLKKQMVVLDKKKGDLWKENWDRQRVFFTWPRGPFDKYKDLKFGAFLKEDSNEFEVFTKNYPDLYPELAKRVAPTKFAGSWTSVFRYVPNWGERNPDGKQIWLALEDLWVQRAVMEPIKVVNDETAAFELLPDPKATPLKRTFRSRVWDLSLEVGDPPANTNAGPYKLLKGRLKNRTGRLQLLGLGNTMRVHVWFNNSHNVQPFPFDIQAGEFVPGDTEVEVTMLYAHILPPDLVITEITKVVQVLDERTVPVRRIDRVALGYPSARHASKALEVPKFWPDDVAAAAPVGGTGTDAASAGGPAGGPGGGPGLGGLMASGPGGGRGGAAAGGPAAVLDANRKRYLEVTDQVRRMPVALVLVVDQMFIPDVLVAYANSPFRFHVVQTHWRRFHGGLGATTGGGTGGGFGGFAPGGIDPSAFSQDSGDDTGQAVGGEAGQGLYGGMYGGGGTQQGYSPGGFGGGVSNTVSEAQANAGLVELSIYGVVSLYEKFEEKKDETVAPADAPKAEDPKPEEKKAEDPKPEEKKADTPPAKAGESDPAKPAADPAAPMPKGGDEKAPAAAPMPKGGDEKTPAPPPPAEAPKKM